jgi:hypothetical protein
MTYWDAGKETLTEITNGLAYLDPRNIAVVNIYIAITNIVVSNILLVII